MKAKIVKVKDRPLQHGIYVDIYENGEKVGKSPHPIWVQQTNEFSKEDIKEMVSNLLKSRKEGLKHYQDFSSLEGEEIEL